MLDDLGYPVSQYFKDQVARQLNSSLQDFSDRKYPIASIDKGTEAMENDRLIGYIGSENSLLIKALIFQINLKTDEIEPKYQSMIDNLEQTQ